MQSKLRRSRAIALTFAMLATMVTAVPAFAHGEHDQGTAEPGDPCNAAEYPGSKLVTLSESRQSFIPSRGGIASVDVCIQNLVGLLGTDFTLRVYEGGTASSPGPEVASVEHDTNGNILSAQWVHIDLGEEVATTPGSPYVIGLDPAVGLLSSVTFQWRATCNDSLLTTCDGVPDAYPDGNTNDLPGNADYAFRTNPLHSADLVGDVELDPALGCPGGPVAAIGTVTNEGLTSVAPFEVEWWLSTDPTLSGDDIFLGTRAVGVLGAGASEVVGAPDSLPDDKGQDALALGDYTLLLHVDSNDDVVESGEGNNVASTSIQVVECGQPDFVNLAIDVDEEQVPTGIHELQFADLDWPGLAQGFWQSDQEALASPVISGSAFSGSGFSGSGFSGSAFSGSGFSGSGFSGSAFSGSAFSGSAFSGSAFSGSAFSGSAFSGSAFSSATCPLLSDLAAELRIGDYPVVMIPIAGEGWDARLGDSLDIPIQNVSLSQALSILTDLTVCEVDLSEIVSFTWMSLATAGSPFDDLGQLAPAGNCAFLADHGFDCAALGFNPAVDSLLTAEALGFKSHLAPIGDRSLTETNHLGATWRVKQAAVEDFFLAVTRGGALNADVALTTPTNVFDCDDDCDRPMYELQANGTTLSGVTIADLMDELTSAGAAAMTLADLAIALQPSDQRALAKANWNETNPFVMDPDGPKATFHVTGDNVGTSSAVDPTVTLTLTPGFVYGGEASLSIDGGAPVPQGAPTLVSNDAGTRTYAFELDGTIASDSSFDLAVKVAPGLYLGEYEAGSATISVVGLEGVETESTEPANVDTVKVVERTPGVSTYSIVNDDEIVIADHISAANDHDIVTIATDPMPARYEVTLHVPYGSDFDLIGYPAEFSGSAFSGSAFSGSGFSGSAFSGSAFSGSAFSGSAFSGSAFSGSAFSGSGFSGSAFSGSAFSSNGTTTTSSADLLGDIPIAELAPDGWRGQYGVSANREDETERLTFFSSFGDSGNLTFAVADYNGDRSDMPYFLTVRKFFPVHELPACATPPWDLSQAPGTAPAEWNGTEEPLTLFVTNKQVTSSAFTPNAYANARSALESLAARPEVRGIVLEVDHDPNVRSAYANWHANWCDPVAANAVASHVRAQIIAMRELHPSIDTVVIAGGDEIVPDWRLPDLSPAGNEWTYVEAIIKSTGSNNPLVAAYAFGTVPSADPYGNEEALAYGSTWVFPPSIGVSRLPEDPASWVAQADQYELTDGTLDPQAGFVSGYDGMVDGATAAHDALEGAGVDTTLLIDDVSAWDANDFRSLAAGADAAGYNAHTAHWNLLSDEDHKTKNPTPDLVTSAEIDSLVPMGGLVFGNGCHFGVNVSDLHNQAPNAEQAKRMDDFVEAINDRAGVVVANSGYGIFDTEIVAHGELLQQFFVEELPNARNAANALAAAKRKFFATIGVQDPYSYKTLQQLNMFGPGIYSMLGSTEQSAETQSVETTPEGDVNITVGPLAVGAPGCTDCYATENKDAGLQVTANVSDADLNGNLSVPGYWQAPTISYEIERPPDRRTLGVWFNDIDVNSIFDVDWVNATVSPTATNEEREPQNAGSFPATPVSWNDYGDVTWVNFMGGVAIPKRMENGKVIGDLHLNTAIDATVVTRDASQPACDPTIDQVQAFSPPDADFVMFDVSVDTVCGQNVRGGMIVRDDTGGTTYKELVLGANGHWTGAIALAPGATQPEWGLFQIQGPGGIAYSALKVDPPQAQTGFSDGLDLALDDGLGGPHESGVYLGPVTATVLGDPGVAYTFYDGDELIGTFLSGQTFVISGDGVHEISGSGLNAAYLNHVAIDGSAPTIVLENPEDGASYPVGTEVTVTFDSEDGGTGETCVATVTDPDGNTTPIASGDLLPTDQVGFYTVTVTCTDEVGHETTVSATYEVTSLYTGVDGGEILFDSPIKPKPQVNKGTSPNQNIAMKFSVYLAGTDTKVSDTSIIVDQCADNNPDTFCAGHWIQMDCGPSSPPSCGDPFVTMGTTPTFADGFHFNIDAPSTAGTYQLVVVLDDGTEICAIFEVGGGGGGGGGGKKK